MVWPFGCVCHAVRAPGVKWTLLALTREKPDGVATVSMYTAPVNHSLGPAEVSRLFLVICIVSPHGFGRWPKVRVQAGICRTFPRVEECEPVRCGAGRRGHACE